MEDITSLVDKLWLNFPFGSVIMPLTRRISLMAKQSLPKQRSRVRFPYPAPKTTAPVRVPLFFMVRGS